MKFKYIKVLIFIAVLFIGNIVNAQGFFKPVTKVVHHLRLSLTDTAASTPTSMNSIRPIVNVASYAIPGNTMVTGAGISYQHLTWNAGTQKWSAAWSVSGLAWYNVPLSGGSPSSIVLYGIAGGVLNNLLLVGVATDGKKAYLTAGVGISLNN